MTAKDVRARPAWRVVIPAHRIRRQTIGGQPLEGVYELPAVDTTRFETGEDAAIEFAVQALHRDHNVPPWMPYFRASVRVARAERTMYTPG
jgi:hypothetical protein